MGGSGAGAITTLGRAGSDLSATVIGAALDLPEVQVWKDVDGALSAVQNQFVVLLVPLLEASAALTVCSSQF